MRKNIWKRFTGFEHRLRSRLRRAPIVYGFVVGIGIILFWRGVWHTADAFTFLNGPMSFVIGLLILLITGVFVSSFIDSKNIAKNIEAEKEIAEETKEEVQSEESGIRQVQQTLEEIGTKLDKIEEKHEKIEEQHEKIEEQHEKKC